MLTEAARMLRHGGVFAAYDYDVVPVIQPDVDAAFVAHVAARSAGGMGGASRSPHVD